MKLKIFAIRDQKSDQFGNPMFLVSQGQAVRSVADEINTSDKKGNVLASHPADFELFVLGSYDTDTGIFETHAPRSVMPCSELVAQS